MLGRADLPCEPVALGPVIAEVSHLAVLDVHPCLSLVFLGLAAAALAGCDLRDGADIRAALAIVFANGVFGSVPSEHLQRAVSHRRREPRQTKKELGYHTQLARTYTLRRCSRCHTHMGFPIYCQFIRRVHEAGRPGGLVVALEYYYIYVLVALHFEFDSRRRRG